MICSNVKEPLELSLLRPIYLPVSNRNACRKLVILVHCWANAGQHLRPNWHFTSVWFYFIHVIYLTRIPSSFLLLQRFLLLQLSMYPLYLYQGSCQVETKIREKLGSGWVVQAPTQICIIFWIRIRGGGGWVGSDQSEFFSDFCFFILTRPLN